MRTTKELLEVMLENIDEYFHPKTCSGLCLIAEKLVEEGIIDDLENGRIQGFLEKYLPTRSHGMLVGYCWPIGEKEPRIKWLKEQIEKLK